MDRPFSGKPGLAEPRLAGFGAELWLARPAHAATTERVIVNRFTGLAIEGFDPVAYFADARAVAGLPDFEAFEAGAVWRFRNEGNRASFMAHPDIYGPQFGGYDPLDLARGVTVAGNPRFWLIVGAAALSVRPRGKPGGLCRRSRALPARCQDALAGAGATAGAVARNRTAAGSPQAMNSGTIKSLRPRPNCRSAPCPSVILPPAAVTMAYPAATSHSQVGARRG